MNKKYKLTRLNDGLVNWGKHVKWIVYKLTGNSIYDEPDVGRGCLIFDRPYSAHWQTTLVQSFTIEPDGTILFTTENSNYKLELVEPCKKRS